MNTLKRIASSLLTMVLLLYVFPFPSSADASSSSAQRDGIRVTQSAEWDTTVPGGATAKVTVKVETEMDLQTPKDVLFVVDCSAQQDLYTWKQNAKELAGYLRKVPGMRAALISYASTPEKLLDFTTDFDALERKIDSLVKGVNSDAYAALQLAKSVIDSRSGSRNPACIAYFGNGRFNMNYHKTIAYAPQLLQSVTVYGILRGSTAQNELKTITGNRIRTPYDAALEIGESRKSQLTVSGQWGGDFAPAATATGQTGLTVNGASGTFSWTTGVTLGRTMELTLSGTLRDLTRTGTLLTVSPTTASVEGRTATAGSVSLNRSGYHVTYDANGGEGTVPVDNTLYGAGATVAVKPAALRRDGWNFSGWTHPTMSIRDSKFAISADTTLNAAWGRAYVKLSSSTLTNGLKGTQMLSRAQIEALDGGSFYDPYYWGKELVSITIHDTIEIPENATKVWDITDTSTGESLPKAVQAWLIRKSYSEYELHIGGEGGVIAPADCTALFETGGAYSLQSIEGLEYLDTSRVTNMSRMFAGGSYSSKVKSLDLSGWNTSNVTDMSQMFKVNSGYASYESIDLSGWDTSHVTNMSQMFYECRNLTNVKMDGWNTSSATDMSGMFYCCMALKSLDVSGWDTSQVTKMNRLFYFCKLVPTLDVSKWNTSNVEDMSGVFYSCQNVSSLDVSGWNTSKVKDFSRVFSETSRITSLDLTGWDTSSGTNMYAMFSRSSFSEGSSLTEIKLGSKWDTSNVTNMSSMFSGCTSMPAVQTAGWDTGKVIQMNYMFADCSALTELDIESWDITRLSSATSMFDGCSNLIELKTGELFKPNYMGNLYNRLNEFTGKVTSERGSCADMFLGCSSLRSLDLSGWTFNAQGISGMFSGCSSLTELDVSDWEFRNPIAVNELFKDCSSLQTIDISGWKCGGNAKISSINGIFQNCKALTSIGMERWDLPEGTTYAFWRSGANTAMDEVKLYLGGEPSNNDATTILPQNAASVPSAQAASAVAAFGSCAELLPAEESEQTGMLTAARSDSTILLDKNKRPVYANDKIGVWDCGQVRPGTEISYSLQLQYLGDPLGCGGTSGLLTVTNPLPEGLEFLPDTLRISTPGRILTGDNGATQGTVVQKPSVEGGVLTFSVTGLSEGAQYTVLYSCRVPDTAPPVYTEFLNTASVDDAGLPDEADPVRHYMLPEDAVGLPTMYNVDYAYDVSAPAGAPAYGQVSYAAGTRITLPQPTAPGYVFNGWKRDGSGSAVTAHTVTENASFIGSWTQVAIPKVRIEYTFTGSGPDNAEAIQTVLLADAVKELPENSVTSAPVPAELPEGCGFAWQYPEGLTVAEDGSFNVGRSEDWPGGVIHITGEWSRERYYVTYRYENAPADAAPLPAEQSYLWGDSVTLADDPANTSTHYFLGWSFDEAIEGDGRTFPMPKTDVAVTGKWEERPAEVVREVKIEPNGGLWDGSDSDRVLSRAEYDKLAGEGIADPVWDGRSFLRWEETRDPDGLFDLILTAQWGDPENVCRVVFDSRGGTPVSPASRSVPKGQPVPEPSPEPTRAGCKFLGWSRTPKGGGLWNFARDTATGDMTLYAVWEEAYSVTGTVYSNGKPVPDVYVKIVQGNTLFADTHTGPDGVYSFNGISPGVYNVVATYSMSAGENAGDGDVTTTIIVTVSDRDVINQTIYISTGRTNSVLEVDDGTPDVVVGGLEAEAEAVRGHDAAPNTVSVEVKMDVAATDETRQAVAVPAIKAAARSADSRRTVDLILDISLSKTLAAGGAPVSEAINQTSCVLEIVIPYDMEGKTGILVHRYHDAGEDHEGAVSFREIGSSDSQEDGTFYLDTNNNLIHVFAKKFSVYAVSYTPAARAPKPSSGGGGSYTVTATAGQGGKIRPAGQVRVSAGASRTFIIQPDEGCAIRDVQVDGVSVGAVSSYTFRNIRANHTIQATFDGAAPGLLNKEDHIEYLHGFPDGTFRPDDSMTRAQAAQMFYNLLRNQDVPGVGAFSDVPESMWYYRAVNAMRALDIMQGVGGNRFEPDRPITRAEFVVTASRFMKLIDDSQSIFSDVAETDWYYQQVSSAVARGWINGYPDGTFRPMAPITRTEAAVIMNRILERTADQDFVDSHRDQLRMFSDVDQSYWAFYAIMETANVHDYRVEGNAEVWTRLR